MILCAISLGTLKVRNFHSSIMIQKRYHFHICWILHHRLTATIRSTENKLKIPLTDYVGLHFNVECTERLKKKIFLEIRCYIIWACFLQVYIFISIWLHYHWLGCRGEIRARGKNLWAPKKCNSAEHTGVSVGQPVQLRGALNFLNLKNVW